MANPQVKFYYKNVTADVVGSEHGITDGQITELAERTRPVITELNRRRKAGRCPYRDLPYNKDNPARVKEIASGIAGCKNFVVLGIGGSALGNIALQTALNRFTYNLDDKSRKTPRFFVFDNVDPPQFANFLDWLGDELDDTVFNVISKSGRTAETACQFLTVRKLLLDKLGAGALQDHVIATTDPEEGTLRRIAEDARLRTLPVPPGVGGRFSVLSPVGLLGAAVCGIDIDALLAGAREMDARVSEEDFFKNPAAINAAVNFHYYNHGKTISVMMPYSYALKDLADWYRQLWAESLGKAENLEGAEVHIGPTPVKALGTTDQHSQVQLYREGPNDKLFTFLQVKDFDADVQPGPAPECAPELEYLSKAPMSRLVNAEKLATEYALLKNKRPCLTVFFDRVTAGTVGQFIYLFEVTTSVAGLLFNINAYDQPAVELGKEATFALMGHPDYADLLKDIRPFTATDSDFLV